MSIHTRVTVAQALHTGSIGFLLPVISFFLLREGLSLGQLGVYTATFGATIFLLEIPFGIVSDQLGRIRTFQLAVVSQCTGCAVLLAGRSVALLFVGAVLFGASRALTSGTLDAWYVEQLTSQNLSHELHRRIGHVLMVSTSITALAALAGGVLPDLATASLFTNPYRLNILMTGLSGVAALAFVWLAFENDRAGGREKRPSLSGIPSIVAQVISAGVRDASLRRLVFLSMLVGYLVASVEAYWQPTLRLSMGSSFRSWYFGVLTAAIFLAKGLGHGASSWLHSRRAVGGGNLHLYCYPATALCFFGLWAGRAPLVLAALLLVIHGLIGIIGPTIDAKMHVQVSNHHRGGIASLFSIVFQFGGALGGLTMGYFVSSSGITAAWAILGGVVLGLTAPVLSYSRKTFL